VKASPKMAFAYAMTAVAVPWAIAMFMLLTSKDKKAIVVVGWVAIGVAILIGISMDSLAENAVVDVLEESARRSSSAFVHVLRYIVPFSVYPVIVYFMKVVSDATASLQHISAETPETDDDSEEDRRVSQTRVISWVIKILIMVFVLISLLTELGIETSDVLQITSIFSLGLSWSMRDWLSGLWACSMMAFTTRLAPNKRIVIGTDPPTRGNNPITDANILEVKEIGLSFLVCTRANGDKSTRIYIPNNVIFNQGFTIVS